AAQAEVAASLLGPWYLACETNEAPPQPVGNRGLRGVPAGCYRCKGDDEWCVIVIRDDADWLALKSVVGDADWIAQRHLHSIIGRLRNRDTLERELGEWTRTQSSRELMTKLQARGVPCGAVQDVADLLRDGQLNSQAFIQPLDQREVNGIMVGGIPLTFDGAS